MVRFKKQITIILIFAFLLSFAPDFLYNKDEVLAACPEGCTAKEGEDGQTYCINCPVECELGTTTFENKSCLPMEGEWACGKEIPIGEVLDRSAYLAAKMADEFGVMIRAGEELVDAARIALVNLPDFTCETDCRYLGCYKYFSISNWELAEGPADECASGPQPSASGIESKIAGETCGQCRISGTCWRTITFSPDPEEPEIMITCKYRPTVGSCQESCSLFRSGCKYCPSGKPLDSPDCKCRLKFQEAIEKYSNIESSQEDLKNDIDEKYKNEGGDTVSLPDTFKFKRSYTLQQLNFSRCELAQCWIPAEDYPDIMEGKKVGKNLFSCKTVSDSGLLEDDQMACSVLQIMEEWEEIQKLWEKPKSWWEWPIVVFQIAWKVITIGWRTLLTMIQEAFDIGKEEGCYPSNYYCCQM